LLTDKSLDHISVNILSSLHSLNYLSLNFTSCTKLTDLGLRPFFLELGEDLKDLKTLSLYFSFLPEVSNISVTGFAYNTLSKLQSLEQLKLEFVGSKKITDESFNQLGQGIIVLSSKRLQNVELNFDKTGVSEESKANIESHSLEIKNFFLK